MTWTSLTAVGAAATTPLTAAELAVGFPLGLDGPAWQASPSTESPRQALEAMLLDLQVESRLFLSFSGGRDSSLLLAIAVDVAKRAGLPLPVPVTLTVAGSADADEAHWQQLVLDHLGLQERCVLPIHHELELLGEVSASVLRGVGLLCPPNTFMHDPMLRQSREGVLVTGAGGDELFGSLASRPARALAGVRRPTLRDVCIIAAGVVAPRLARRQLRRVVPALPWLSPAGRDVYERTTVAAWGLPHDGWAKEMARFEASRYVAALRQGCLAMAAHTGGRMVHPLLTPRFFDAMIRVSGRAGLGGRTTTMTAIAGDLLPPAVLSRSSKASFGDAVWGPRTAVVRRDPALLDAIAADPDLAPLVDLDVLRQEWAGRRPHFLTALLLHAAAAVTGHIGL